MNVQKLDLFFRIRWIAKRLNPCLNIVPFGIICPLCDE